MLRKSKKENLAEKLKKGIGKLMLWYEVAEINQDAFLGYTLQNVLLRMCGHKEIHTPEDERSFGFPFDREISFPLSEDLKYYMLKLF